MDPRHAHLPCTAWQARMRRPSTESTSSQKRSASSSTTSCFRRLNVKRATRTVGGTLDLELARQAIEDSTGTMRGAETPRPTRNSGARRERRRKVSGLSPSCASVDLVSGVDRDVIVAVPIARVGSMLVNSHRMLRLTAEQRGELRDWSQPRDCQCPRHSPRSYPARSKRRHWLRRSSCPTIRAYLRQRSSSGAYFSRAPCSSAVR